MKMRIHSVPAKYQGVHCDRSDIGEAIERQIPQTHKWGIDNSKLHLLQGRGSLEHFYLLPVRDPCEPYVCMYNILVEQLSQIFLCVR